MTVTINKAPWRSGYVAVCKTVYTGSSPVGASNIWAGGGMVYTEDLKSSARKGLRVRAPPRLPVIILAFCYTNANNQRVNTCQHQ
jgi:hypothetical protein